MIFLLPPIIFTGLAALSVETQKKCLGEYNSKISSNLFAFITLPVEYDASKRALAWIDERNIVTGEEHEMAKDALNAAARTYLVAALGSLAMLIYYASMMVGGD